MVVSIKNMYCNYLPTPPICNVSLLTEAVVSIYDNDDDDDDDDEYDE